MIIFYDKRDGKIFGTVDGRVHDEEFANVTMMKSSNIPEEFTGKLVIPTKQVIEEILIPIKEQFADPEDGFKIKQKDAGNKIEKRIKELDFDVPFADIIHRHEDAVDPLKLVECRVVLNKDNEVTDIVEDSNLALK